MPQQRFVSVYFRDACTALYFAALVRFVGFL